MSIDDVTLGLAPQSFTVLNAVLGLVMFGVALDLRAADFARVARAPKGPVIGLLAQLVLLPAATFLLTRLLAPPPSIALGMILVASCPGGNLSNFLTHLAGGRTELSIGMTAVSTLAAIVMTPLNVALWGSLAPETAALLHRVAVDPLAMLGTIALLLAVPLAAGMLLAARAPRLAARLRGPFRYGSIGAFALFVAVAFQANWGLFTAYLGVVFLPVLLHNALALGLGFGSARLARLSEGEVRAVALEVGIQNSGLGLLLILQFFGGLGGMALIAAWWGIWHIVAGLTVAGLWSRRPAVRLAEARP